MAEFWTGPVKSMTLEEILAERPTRLARALRWVKFGLTIWGGLTLAAAGGTSAYYLGGDSAEPVLVSQAKPASQHAAAPQHVVAALADLPAPEVSQAGTFSAATPPILNPSIEARVPRPRPDEPIVTGSIPRADAYPYYRPRRAYPDPCHALRRMGAPFRLRVRCDEARYQPRPAPPPPHAYYRPQN